MNRKRDTSFITSPRSGIFSGISHAVYFHRRSSSIPLASIPSSTTYRYTVWKSRCRLSAFTLTVCAVPAMSLVSCSYCLALSASVYKLHGSSARLIHLLILAPYKLFACLLNVPIHFLILARDVIYTSRTYATHSVTYAADFPTNGVFSTVQSRLLCVCVHCVIHRWGWKHGCEIPHSMGQSTHVHRPKVSHQL